MPRSRLQFRLRTLLMLVALTAISLPTGERLRGRWRHCRERAELCDSMAEQHRDAATWPGQSAWAIANQRRKALLADATSSRYRWAALLPFLPLPDDPYRGRK